MNLRIGIYRGLQRWVVEPWLLSQRMSAERLQEERMHGLRVRKLPPRSKDVARAWFHAASVGELESLMPVIEAWLDEAGGEAIVTVLSESAGSSVRRLSEAKRTGTGVVLYAGYSPWEGRWGTALASTQVDVFVTAKYEAWPELWTSLAALDIPLLIVGAKARRSLRIASVLCFVLGGAIPRIRLLTVSEDDALELKSTFKLSKQVDVQVTGEPRWDRVQTRASQSSARARELLDRFKDLPKPWGILAQVWSEDMEVWRGDLGRRSGTLWVVPHRVDSEHVERVASYLERAGVLFERTSFESEGARIQGARCILVDEVGVLLELYSEMDWVYVGGGFGVGMHSTIEPALQGLPIACGPTGVDQFPEIVELRRSGQLRVVDDHEALECWLESLEMKNSEAQRQRARWRSEAVARLGATRRVLDVILRS